MLEKPFTGDLDALIKRRAIRVAVTFNRTHYFIDQGQERGLTYESLKLFENDLNTDLKTGNLRVHVVIVPMSREQLYPALSSGKVDMVAAMVTVHPSGKNSSPSRTRRAPVSTKSSSPGRERRQSPRWTIWPARKSSSAKGASTTRASRP